MLPRAKIPQSASEPLCFHCALPVPAGRRFGAVIDGAWRAMCCPGCEVIAQTIADRGLTDYYRWREAAPERAQPLSKEAEDSFRLYDEPLVQSRFVRCADEGNEATLLLEGIRCLACVWLIEQSLLRIAGVRRVNVNYATHRATVLWAPQEVALSTILKAVRAVGYVASPYDAGRMALVQESERRRALWRLFVAGFATMQVMMYAIPVYLAGEGAMSADLEQLMRWAGLILTLPVVLYSVKPFFTGAWRDLRSLRPGMDVPVALGIGVAFGASAWATIVGRGAVYFDSVAMFVFLLLAGRYLEMLARQRAARPLEHLSRVVPEMAQRLSAVGLAAEIVPVAALQPGDRVLVRPGETVPADGACETAATVSEAVLTGESRALHKPPGGRLIGGALNVGNALIMRVSHVGAATVLSSIIAMVERAMSERPPLVDLSRRAATLFVIVVLLTALGAALAWSAIEPARALWVAVSVLIVTCPCALSLATPAALTVATGEMAARGLIPTRGGAIESLAAATDFVFDKTGTLTQGTMQLLETLPLRPCQAAHCLQIAGAIERASEHPIASAFVQAAAGDLRTASNIQNAHGRGVEAVLDGRRHRIGRADYVAELHGKAPPLAWLRTAHTVVWLGDEQGWIAAFQVGDAMRAGARETVAALQAMGMRVHLLSGDEVSVAAKAAKALGIARMQAGAGPEEKLAYVRELQRNGARVAMIGDGINDTPVLARADVSIAMASGSDLAQVQADAVLLSESLMPLAEAAALARRTRAILRQNLVWALGYNLVVIPVALAGLVTPLIAGIGMSASSLLVVLNALRLRQGQRR